MFLLPFLPSKIPCNIFDPPSVNRKTISTLGYPARLCLKNMLIFNCFPYLRIFLLPFLAEKVPGVIPMPEIRRQLIHNFYFSEATLLVFAKVIPSHPVNAMLNNHGFKILYIRSQILNFFGIPSLWQAILSTHSFLLASARKAIKQVSPL